MSDDLPADGLGEAFGAVARRLRSAAMRAFAAYDVTPSQVRAIRVLASHGGVRSKELADHLRIAPRSATEVVDALEAKGLVARSPDPGDRRLSRCQTYVDFFPAEAVFVAGAATGSFGDSSMIATSAARRASRHRYR